MAEEDDGPELKTEVDEESELRRIQGVAADMKSALSRNSPADAIKVAVTAFPSKGKEEAARKAAAEAFAAALLAVPRDGIDTIINSLSSKDRTTVLKYVYKSMSLPFDKKSYDLLLLWQNKIVTLEGHGSIMRAMSDRKV